jgi:hypothetical protein
MAIPKAENKVSAKPSYKTSIPTVPITQQRPLHIPSKDSPLADPSVARVNIAATADAPNGTTENDHAARHAGQTVLQQHCAYWDKDADGIIWPWDTYNGVRAWGWAIPLALLAMFIIHSTLSFMTLPGFLPDPFFRIYLNKIHKDKHGSDSGSYDNEGRFRPQNYEEIFTKYDRGNKGGLTTGDIWRMLSGQRLAVDPFGWTASALECECFSFPHVFSPLRIRALSGFLLSIEQRTDESLVSFRVRTIHALLARRCHHAQGGCPSFVRWQHLPIQGR